MPTISIMFPALFFLFLLQTNFLSITAQSTAIRCLNNGNYTLNSTYANNLDAVLSSLATNIGDDGFYNASVGSSGPDRANAIAFCTGDRQVSECRNCISQVVIPDLRATCPNQKQAMDWSSFCMVRYSNETIVRQLDTQLSYYVMNPNENGTYPTAFREDLSRLLTNLTNRATNGGPMRKVAAGNILTNALQYIFALVQCTPDLSADDCGRCLIGATSNIPTYCEGKRSICRLVYASCTLEYQTNLFYNNTRLLELGATAQSPTIRCLNDNGNYMANTTYANNLDAALSSLPTNIGDNGFYSASVGSSGPDRANAIAFCTGDRQLTYCRTCISQTVVYLREGCPDQKQAMDWSSFCMVRYSNATIVGQLDMTFFYNVTIANENGTNLSVFSDGLRKFLNGLTNQATSGGSMRKVAAGNISTDASKYIFALVQCTPDLSADDCGSCLTIATAGIPTYCPGKRSVCKIVCASCTLEYQTNPFYNNTRLLELKAAAPQPPQAGEAPTTPSPPGNNTTPTIIIVIVSIAACLIVAVFVWIFLRNRVKRTPETTHYESIDDMSMVESLKYELSTLRAATNDFSDDNKLGQGGFGVVYKGILSNGKEIAVKRLSQGSEQGDQEFKNEVLLLAKLQQRNLVRLIGYCLEGMEKLLVYEFVENASLDKFIFDPIKRSHLDWEKRYKIISGIARGILYLHEDSQFKIVHRDLKPGNVLLDGAMNPKIADFGMARLFQHDDTHGNTNRIAGTFGYIAPEYGMYGNFSMKSDVYSFGVVVLEIISGIKNNSVQPGSTVENLLSLAWKSWHESSAANMVDPCLKSGSCSLSEMLRCIHIGLLCVQEDAADRPTMASVVSMLNNHSRTMATPTKRPAFFMPNGYASDTSLPLENNACQLSLISSSKNEISISDFYPR